MHVQRGLTATRRTFCFSASSNLLMGDVYVECHQRELCGHVRVSHAVLSGGLLRLELATRPPHVVAIRLKADNQRFRQLTAMLKTIIGVRRLELASGESHSGN